MTGLEPPSTATVVTEGATDEQERPSAANPEGIHSPFDDDKNKNKTSCSSSNDDDNNNNNNNNNNSAVERESSPGKQNTLNEKKKRTATTRNKRPKPTTNTLPKDTLGPVDSFPSFQEARMALNQRLPWFRDHQIPSDLPVKHIESPPGFDWEHAGHKEMDHVFPFWKMENGRSLGKRQIPKCLLLDSNTELERLVVLNWWRSLTGEQQIKLASHQGLQRYYRAPNRSASPFQYAQPGLLKGLDALDFGKQRELTVRVNQEVRIELANERETVPRQEPPDDHGEGERDNTKETTTTIPGNKSASRMKTSFVHPTVATAPLGFRAMQSTHDLVQRFNLSVDILYCARTVPQKCAIDECSYPALDQNRGCCALHKQNWWVRKMGAQPQRRRGHLLLGPEYATRRTIHDIVATEGTHRVAPVACGCNSDMCEAIGWSAETVRVPKHVVLPDGLVPGEHRDKDRPLRLAPWHFPPESRIQLPDGTWKLLFGQKAEDFVYPHYDVSEFIKEPGMVDYQKRKSLWLLPEWVYEMQAKEEGPPTLAEYQRDEFRTQQKELMLKATMAVMAQKDLIRSHSEVNVKLQSMKKNYIHRKRVNTVRSPRKRRKTETGDGTRAQQGIDDEQSSEAERSDHDDPNSEHDGAASGHAAPTDATRIPNRLRVPGGGTSLLRPHQVQMHAAWGGLNPYTADAGRLEEAAHRVWGHYYANYGRQM